jgi:hypothetical protein
MAKKKLLNEATVRRFMGLAGMESNLVSNKINEMGYGKYKRNDNKEMEEGYDKPEEKMEEDLNEEEEMLPAEEPMGMDMDADIGEKPAEEPMDLEKGDEGEMDLDQDEARDIVDAVKTLMSLSDKLEAQLGDEEEMMDLGDEEEEEEEAEEEEEEEEADEEAMLEDVDLQLSEEEIVSEVAKRVAKRILKAKKAKKALDEALGRTQKS